MKNKFAYIFSIVLALLIGGAIGFRLDRKLVQKEGAINCKENFPPAPVLIKNNKSEFHFFLPENKIIGQISLDQLAQLNSVLSTKTYKISILIKKIGSPKFPFHPQTGVMDASKIVELNSVGGPYSPIYAASPHEKAECFSEIQFATLKNNNINSVEDLANKNIGMNAVARPLINMTLKTWVAKNIKANSFNIFKSPNSLVNALTSGKVDAIALRVQTFSNGETHSVFGTMNGNSYSNFSNIKILSTTENRIPCNIIFVNSDLPTGLREEIINKYVDVFSQEESRKLMGELLKLNSITTITPEKWQPIQNKLKDVHWFDMNQVTKKVLSE